MAISVARAKLMKSRSGSTATSRRTATARRSSPSERKQALQSPLRKQIMKAVQKAPGLPLSHLLTRLDVGWSTLYRELDVLVDAGLVKSRKRGRHCLVYPTEGEGGKPVPISQAILLQGATAREIAARIAKKPGQNMETIAEHLDLSPRVVYYHLRRLVEARLVKSSSSTRYRDLSPTPLLKDLLKSFEGRGSL